MLFELQFNANLPYQRFCQARGVLPSNVSHWAQIPAVPTSAFKELEMTSLAPNQRSLVFHSSGTTDQRPSRHFHNAASLQIYEASLLVWFEPNFLPDLCGPQGTNRLLTSSAAKPLEGRPAPSPAATGAK